MVQPLPPGDLSWPGRFAAWPASVRFLLFLASIALAHLSLLHLPYFWDEGGYYVPAALDFFHRGTLIPEFSNAHPPLPNVVLGLLWHGFGFHILVTRLTACAFAAAGLLAVFELTNRLLDASAALTVVLLTAVYPIWFAQSSLAHADIFAAAFTLAGLAVYLTAPEQAPDPAASMLPLQTAASVSSSARLLWSAAFFCLAVLSKETALLQPVTLAVVQTVRALRGPRDRRRNHLRWAEFLSTPIAVLALWFAYHHWKTGFTFGNPVFLRYNATSNFTLHHVARALLFRFLHLFWQRNIWVPLVLGLASLLLPRLPLSQAPGLPGGVLRDIALLVAANWLAFSVFGGALLTRYLLPVYPLEILVCVWLWRTHLHAWPWLAALTACAFLVALWLNPSNYFAPEDNLTYRDLILVHQDAIAWLAQHDPEATVLTAWPGAAELTRPELGYTQRPFQVYSLEDFSRTELARAAAEPGGYDTALVFTTHYTSPGFRTFLITHPGSRRGRKYARERDLTPSEIARLLDGTVAWQEDRNGEWAAILRFNRRYDAALQGILPLPGITPRLAAPASLGQ